MDSFRAGAIRLFRVAGIDVFLHWTWFLVAVFQISQRGGYGKSLWNVIEYLSLFGIVLLHEFGHALACRSVGGTARQIVLWPLGGIAFVRPPARPGAVLWSIAAGPLVNLVLVPVTLGLLWSFGNGGAVPDTDLGRYLLSITVMNAFIMVLNLLPIYPLDGGQILGALLWFAVGRWRSLQIVSFLGMLAGGSLLLLIVPLGLITGVGQGQGNVMAMEIMLAVMAMFVVTTSAGTFFQARHFLHIESLPRHEEIHCPSCSAHPPAGPFWVCEHCQTRFDTFTTHGTCPACGAWYHDTTCPNCQHTHHINHWMAPESHQPVPAADEPDPNAWAEPEA
jgi:Zn-dependent protease